MEKTKTDVLNILYQTHRKTPGEWVNAEHIRKALDIKQEDLHDFIIVLNEKSFIETNFLDNNALLKITAKGIAILKPVESYENSPTQGEDEPETTAIREYPEFSWNLLAKNHSQHLQTVRRHDIVATITKTLDDTDDRQLIFLYERQPRVGKGIVLKGLQETVSQTYIPVYMNFSGWSSIENQADFLEELADNIQYEIELFMPDAQIESFNHVAETQATKEFARFMHSLAKTLHCNGKLFLFIFDELDYLQRFEADKHIFEYFRGFIQKYSRRARFIFAGSGDIFDLLEHSELVALLAHGNQIVVECFAEEISRELVKALTHDYFELEESVIDMIIKLSNGHPELLKEMLGILVRYWENHGRNEQISIQDVMNALDDIRTELSPKLKEIWLKLSLSEQRIMQHIVRSGQQHFTADDIDIEQKNHLLRDLRRLVDRQILNYKAQCEQYTVRLGLLTDLIAYGILS